MNKTLEIVLITELLTNLQLWRSSQTRYSGYTDVGMMESRQVRLV